MKLLYSLFSLPVVYGQGFSSTMLRFGYSEVVLDRINPLVEPGGLLSAHVHQVVGGNAFNVTMPYTDISKLATCTTYTRVPQMVNDMSAIGNANAPGPKTVTAFKPGFRMFTGDAARRTSTNLGRKMQSCYRCYTGPNFQGNNMSPCMDPKLDTESFPTTPCPGGIRSSVIFPICWDGKNLDTPNHMDHVAHPTSGPATFAVVDAACPASHPVKIPQVHYEIVWDTRAFNNKADWPADGSQPFVLSQGDPTGYGQHGDYVFGWKDDSLQHAMDNRCFAATCRGLTTQGFDKANKCQVKRVVKEDIDGCTSTFFTPHLEPQDQR
ncbi:hypothetical protein B0T21DRAFT_405199 [Apiosordaria backusii]|uniref:DUF1996 domain-containing protein n=1 Tax=Apiosordaria backusii TaxID=314023 RepID=A0AA40A456_9PEZI|nr:hypothetical protein B0T21DRAFT_405199 [Apiosordaria backusii]